MKNQATAVLIFMLFTGCATTNAKTSDNEYIEPVKGNSVDFYLYGVGDDNSDSNVEKIFAESSADFDKHCPEVITSTQQQDLVGPILVPLITTLAKYIFDNIQDKKIERLEALKRASKSTYSGNAFLSSTELQRVRCAVLVRSSMVNGKKKPGLIIVVKIRHLLEAENQAFYIQPTFIKANNSSAKTKKGKVSVDGKLNHPRINIAIGFVLKAISSDRDSGFPRLKTVGTGAATVGNVELPTKKEGGIANGKNPCLESCSHSGLIPHVDGGQIVSISMAITETGQVGIDFDRRKAEITAIKEAFGPAIKDSLKEALSGD